MGPPQPSGTLTVEVRQPSGEAAVHRFDASSDRRVIIGRADSCDLVVLESGCSRKNTMLLATQAGWLVQDLGSSNGTFLNGDRIEAAPFEPGDVLRVGTTEIRIVGDQTPRERLVVDLLEGRAALGGHELPLYPAELIWFGLLCACRAGGAGWVVAGREGHPQLRAFAAALLERQWARAVKTQPLLALARGDEVDDEDLKNLRGKTAQKLRSFCAGERVWMAKLLVPEVSGKNLQRLPLPPAALSVLGAPDGNVAEAPARR